MKGASLQYLTKEGFRNIWVNRLMSLASVTVLMACLVIIGLGAMMFFNINSLLDSVEQQNVVMVFIEDNTNDEQITNLGNEIKAIDNVESCVFVSKEEAFEAQKKKMGNDAVILEGLDGNPLPDAYRVTLKNLDLFRPTVDSLHTLKYVDSIRENSDLAAQLLDIRKAVTAISVGIFALLFLVSLFIISNTIRITMFSRKLEISIMKAVGATNWFIRWPFMIEGVAIGIISGLVSFGVLAGLYSGLTTILNSLLKSFNAVSFWNYAGYILLIFTAIGIFTGSFGSVISMGRYLKEQGSVVNED